MDLSDYAYTFHQYATGYRYLEDAASHEGNETARLAFSAEREAYERRLAAVQAAMPPVPPK